MAGGGGGENVGEGGSSSLTRCTFALLAGPLSKCMGRHSGYLTAESARQYRAALPNAPNSASLGVPLSRFDIHGCYIPEVEMDIAKEGARLRSVMDAIGCVNVFLSEGAGVDAIVAEKEGRGEDVEKDAFGHVRLESINPGAYFAKR